MHTWDRYEAENAIRLNWAFENLLARQQRKGNRVWQVQKFLLQGPLGWSFDSIVLEEESEDEAKIAVQALKDKNKYIGVDYRAVLVD